MSGKKGWGIEAVGLWFVVFFVEAALGLALYQALDLSSKDGQELIVPSFIIAIATAVVAFVIVKTFMDKRGGMFKMLGLDKFKKEYWLQVLGYFVLYFGLMILASYLVSLLYPSFNIDQEQNFGFNEATENIELVLAFVSLVIVTPFIEELVFRGLIFKGLRRDFGFVPAVIVSSGIFALLHGQVNVAIDTFILGTVAAYTLDKTNSLWPAILLHGIKNFIAFVAIFFIGI